MSNITYDEAIAAFEYRDGELFWKIKPAMRVHVGDKAGWLDKNATHLRVLYKGKKVMVHRIVYLMHHGHLPECVDHVDRNPLNNKIENLREATKSQNSCNKKVRSDSGTGIKNVTYYRPSGKWRVAIAVNGKRKHIGYFADMEQAKIAAENAGKMYHGQFYSKGAA